MHSRRFMILFGLIAVAIAILIMVQTFDGRIDSLDPHLLARGN